MCGVRTYYPNLSQLVAPNTWKYVRDNATIGTSCFLAVWVLYVSRGSALMRVLRVPGTYTLSNSSFGVNSVCTASTRSTEILSVCSVTLGVRSILGPSVHRLDNYQAHCSAQITHRWFDEWELEYITFAGDTSNTWSTGIISGIWTARSIYCEHSRYLDVLPFFYPERQETFNCGNLFCVLCWTLLSRSQSIMSQPRPHATFCTYV